MADGNLVSEVSKQITSTSNGKLGTKPLSFSDVVQGLCSSQNQSAPYASTDCKCAISCSSTLKPVSYFEDKPCIAFAVSEVKRLEANLKFALIGKFSHGRPSSKSIREFLVHLKLNGSFNLVTLNKKHVLIECSNLEDFHRLWLKLAWYIDGFHMRMFKWEPSYTPEKESSIAPVWIRIEGLPLHLFGDMPLRSIANSIGKPIKIDPRNMNRTLLSVARVCVELDVSKPFVDAIRLSFVDDVTGIEVDSRWLQVYYDVVPQYCVSCFHIGHGMANCKRAIQQVTNVPDKSATSSAEQLHFKQVWLPVDRNKTLFAPEKQQAEANNATVMVDAETQILELPSSHSGAAKESSGAGQVSTFLALNIPDQTSSDEPQQPETTAGHQSVETAATTVVENDAMHNDEASTDQDNSVETAAASGVETAQPSPSRTAAARMALPTDQDEDFCTVLQPTHIPVNNIGKEGYSDKIMQQVNGLMKRMDDKAAATKEYPSPHGTDVTEMQQKSMDIQTALNSQAIPFSPKQKEQIPRAHKADLSPAAAPNKKDNEQRLIDMEQNFSRSTATTVELKSTAEAEPQQESVQNKRHTHQKHLHSSSSSHSWADQMEKIDMRENTVMQGERPTSLANHKLQQLEVQNRFDVLLLEDSDPYSRRGVLAGEHVDTAATDQDNKAIVLAVLPVLVEDEGQAFQAEETGTHQGQKEVPAVSSVVQEKEVPIYHTSSSTWADQAETEDDIANQQDREPQYNGLAFKLQEGDKDIHTAEKVRYIDFEKIDVFDDIIAPSKPGSVPSSPRSKFSRRAPALDDLALIHSKDELEFSSIHKVDEYPDDWWADNMEMEPTSSFRNRYNFRVRKSSRKGFKYRG